MLVHVTAIVPVILAGVVVPYTQLQKVFLNLRNLRQVYVETEPITAVTRGIMDFLFVCSDHLSHVFPLLQCVSGNKEGLNT
jgi:hypothetical protein